MNLSFWWHACVLCFVGEVDAVGCEWPSFASMILKNVMSSDTTTHARSSDSLREEMMVWETELNVPVVEITCLLRSGGGCFCTSDMRCVTSFALVTYCMIAAEAGIPTLEKWRLQNIKRNAFWTCSWVGWRCWSRCCKKMN